MFISDNHMSCSGDELICGRIFLKWISGWSFCSLAVSFIGYQFYRSLDVTRLWVDVSIVLVFVTGSSSRCCSSISSFHVICWYTACLPSLSWVHWLKCHFLLLDTVPVDHFGFSHTYYKESISVSGLKSHCFGNFQIFASRHIVQQRRLFYHLQQVPGQLKI